MNTVERLEGGRLRGHSTDGEGFFKSMALPLFPTLQCFSEGAELGIRRSDPP